jgi:hypothetical protein
MRQAALAEVSAARGSATRTPGASASIARTGPEASRTCVISSRGRPGDRQRAGGAGAAPHEAGGGSITARHAGAALMYYGGAIIGFALAIILMTQWYQLAGRELARTVRR